MGARSPSAGREAPASPDLARALLGGALVLFCLLLFAQFGLLFARNEPLFFVDSSRLDSIDFPPWAPALWKEETERALREGAVRPIFEDLVLQESRTLLASLPFVERVELVSRRFPRAVAAKIVLRRPIALVRSEGKLYAVDRAGVVLPGKPGATDGGFAFPLPTIQKGSFQAPPPSGQCWRDAAVQDGVAVALDLDPLLDMRPGFRIAAIDLTNLGGRASRIESEIVLLTDGGVRILWGRSSLRKPYGELSPEAKLGNLERVLEEFPGLEGVREVDLRFDRPAVALKSP